MRELIWRSIARIVSKPAVAEWLIRRAAATPYSHITGPDGSIYMGRWWLFNPYPIFSSGDGRRWAWLPSVRVHHIIRPDSDRHMHDHPWNARTIILKGWYCEQRQLRPHSEHLRLQGYTGRLLFGQFHRIDRVSPGGAWTVFITWKKRGTWGFDVDGVKVPWREYLGIDQEKTNA